MWMSKKPVSVSVTDASTLVIPACAPGTVATWVAGLVAAAGSVCRNATGQLYWTVAGGTCGATALTHESGDASDGGVTWRRLYQDRSQLVLVNDSTVVIYLGIGFAAEANRGIRLNAGGGAMNFLEFGRVPECAIYAIGASAGPSVLGVQEG
jgi:hypothetical protein